MGDNQMNRRSFAVVAAAAGASLLLPGDASAAPTAAEQANIKLVNDFCATWASRDINMPLAFMATDVVYRMTETTPPASGHEGVIARLKTYLETSRSVEFKVLDTYAV